MIFYLLNILINTKSDTDSNINFIIIFSSISYFLIINFYFNKFLTFLIPFDLFITFNYLNNSKKKKKICKDHFKKNKNTKVLDNFIENKISINDTLEYTMNNLKLN